MSLSSLLVPTFTNMLGALSAWLDKAEAERPDGQAEALLTARLAPDMFPLGTQIRFACIQAGEAVARLMDQPFPPLLTSLREEALGADERPGTLADARARIAGTLDMLAALEPGALDRAPDSALAHHLPVGMIFDFTAESYARDWSLGQFYFHIMIAYAILRAQGVALGKADYIPHVLPNLRPGTAPQG